MAFFIYILEIWPLLLWKFGLGSYSRFKIHWCLAPRFTVWVTLTVKILGHFNFWLWALELIIQKDLVIYIVKWVLVTSYASVETKTFVSLATLVKIANLVTLAIWVKYKIDSANLFWKKSSYHHYNLLYITHMNIFGGLGGHQAPSKTPLKSPRILTVKVTQTVNRGAYCQWTINEE